MKLIKLQKEKLFLIETLKIYCKNACFIYFYINLHIISLLILKYIDIYSHTLINCFFI